jgi:hypothetical protein
VVVPVFIDQPRPEGSHGLMEAVLALKFDPTVFTVSASDIQLGSVPSSGSGWQLRSAINQETGELGIDLFSSTPLLSRAGGSLVLVTFHVREGAEVGSAAINLVPQVNPTGRLAFQTHAADMVSPYILYPVITDGIDAGVDGRVLVPSVAGLGQTAAPQFVMAPVAAGMAEAASVGSFDLAPLSASLTSEMPRSLVEQAFEEMELSGLLYQDDASKADALLDRDGEDAKAAARELALLWQADQTAEGEGLADDYRTTLNKSARRGRKLVNPIGDNAESEDLSALEAFFANEGATEE